MKNFLNKNNGFGFSDSNITKFDETDIYSRFPKSCWSFQNDCEANCEGLTYSGECIKKTHKMFKDESQYCCFVFGEGRNNN